MTTGVFLLSNGTESFLRLITAIVVFILVLALTYFVTRWIGKFQQGMNPGSHVTVLETFKVASNKYIQVIKVGEIYMVIAICKDTITMLTRLDEIELGDIPSNLERKTDNFSTVLDRFKNLKPKK